MKLEVADYLEFEDRILANGSVFAPSGGEAERAELVNVTPVSPSGVGAGDGSSVWSEVPASFHASTGNQIPLLFTPCHFENCSSIVSLTNQTTTFCIR